ncbi:glycosyltransferase family 2 protein [Arenibacter palladensis]|uniref:glycosyltransferase family 2 protein n=1 Tax=Arenibacter palladensis TaxID=237373 RepID=UPI002FD31899
MLLSILIPTYNRSYYLQKNLESLTEFVLNTDETDKIEIIVSNNCSSDDTHHVIPNLIESHSTVIFRYFLQSQNIGLEKNALFTLSQAKGEFVMYLGDDDYIENNYLQEILSNIKKNKNLGNIIPSYMAIDVNKNNLGFGRDLNLQNAYFKAGFENCLNNSWRGHQLSGLVLKRDGLYNAYNNNCVNNIYLFIYFVSYNCLRGDTIHITNYPVKVTQPGQQNKDWGYGKDGLVSEIFDNYKKLKGINIFERSKLEIKLLDVQDWRYTSYRQLSHLKLLRAILLITFGKNTSVLTKVQFPLLLIKKIFIKITTSGNPL